MYRFIFLVVELMRFAVRFGLFTRTTPNGMVAYQRIFEFGETLAYIRKEISQKKSLDFTVLDIGGDRTIFPFFLAFKYPITVDIIDLGDMEFAKKMLSKMPHHTASRIRLIPNQDATSMAADAQYDAITIISVIEHIPDDGDRLLLKQIHNKLKTDGVLIITAPFTAKEQTILFYNKNNYYKNQQVRDTDFYMRLYSKEGINQLAKGAKNLEIEALLFAGESGFLFSEKVLWRRTFFPYFGEYANALIRKVFFSVFYPISPIFALFFIKISPSKEVYLDSEEKLINYIQTPNAFFLALRKEVQ